MTTERLVLLEKFVARFERDMGLPRELCSTADNEDGIVGIAAAMNDPSSRTRFLGLLPLFSRLLSFRQPPFRSHPHQRKKMSLAGHKHLPGDRVAA